MSTFLSYNLSFDKSGFSRFGWRSNRPSVHGLSLHIEKGLGAARAAQREGDADLPAFARRISPPLEEGILSAL